ncbi:MAG: hypothetical protein KDE47_32290, partial [Caldilineaceae bacterium]|nr:hypothetical protein [Caldilineaceae bacterium]
MNDVAKVAGKPQRSLLFLSTVLCLALLALTGCGSGMSDDDKEIAIAVALTQTAAAVEPTLAATPTAASSSDATSAEATGAETGAEEPTATAAPAEPTATPLPAEPTATTAEVAAADGAPTATPLTAAGLPVTQNRLKVRTLLVAPGEPGALYALLTDQVDDRAPATNAQFLTSLDFGVTWQAAPSGLPVAEDCLYNINMDYYDATALYASTCQGIYRWSKASGAWSAVADQETRMVAVVYGNANLIWATRPVTDTAAAPVILSQNGGQSWQEIPMAHTKGVAALNISPRDSQSGYAL